MTPAAAHPAARRPGFTLIELMLSTSLIALIALLLVSMTNSTAATWRYTTSRIEQFRSADAAFESITRRLSQATLNTYWDYDSPTVPTKYLRQSDLRFITGPMTTGAKALLTTKDPRRPTHGVFFQAPLGLVDEPKNNFTGLDNLLNTCGYYIEFNKEVRPQFLDDLGSGAPPLRYRYRLMEFTQPSNALSLYSFTSGSTGGKSNNAGYTAKTWFSNALPVAPAVLSPAVHVMAENIIALVLQPKLSKKDETSTGKTLSTDYIYDSTATNTDPDINPKNQLPPIVQVTLVAIDENSASRAANGATPPAFDASLDTIFQKFQKTSDFDTDLATLQTTLLNSKPPISFRVFTSNVSIRGAKWSRK